MLELDPETSAQLQIIVEVTDLLNAASIPYWLFGGWALDFILGEITRQHEDVEFITWAHDIDAIRALLRSHGYEEIPSVYPEEMAIFSGYGQKLEFDLIARNSNGLIVIPGRWSDWPWPEAAFEQAPVRFGQAICPVIAAEQLLETKEHYADHMAGAPLRDKDRGDIARLREFLGIDGGEE